MRRLIAAMIGALCLCLSVSCSKLENSGPLLVGEWSALSGEKLVFDRYGRLVVFDHSGNAVANATYQYAASNDTVRMPTPSGTLVGKMVGTKRMQVTGVDGRRRIFALKEASKSSR